MKKTIFKWQATSTTRPAVSWNFSGLGHSAAIPFICELVRARKHNVICLCELNVIFLCETIAHMNKIDEIRARLHYDCAFTIDCIGRSGGLCVLWNSSSFCDIVNNSQYHIDIMINDMGEPRRSMELYGYLRKNKRRLSWSLLR